MYVEAVSLLVESTCYEVHLRCTDEACNEEVNGRIIEVLRSVNLLDETVLHNYDTGSHCHSLYLVVSYVDECCTESLVDLCKLSSHGCTELCVQVGERLVEKEYLRITNDSTTQRNTLLLTTGKSLRLSLEEVRNVEDTSSLFYAALDLLLGSLAELKTECHVIKYGHVRIKSVVLENHRDITVLRCYVVYESVADEELTFGDLLKTCDHTKSCGLTASGRANEDKELFVLDIEAEVGYSGNAAGIFLVDMLQGKTCHCVIPP